MNSMTPNQAQALARLLRSHREKAGISASELARRAGVDKGTVTRIELGQIPSPKADNLRAIAEAIGLSASDVFTAAGWVPAHELPTMRPYLRTKYRAMPAEAVAEIEAYADRVAREYGVSFDPADPTSQPNGDDE